MRLETAEGNPVQLVGGRWGAPTRPPPCCGYSRASGRGHGTRGGGGGGRAHVAEYGAARAKSFHSGYSTIGILVCATVTSHVVCRAEVAQGWMTVEEVA